jgi:tetratricopeptide (TPR) repeat protein
LRGEICVAVDLIKPLPEYIIKARTDKRHPIILRGTLCISKDPYQKYLLKNAEYQGYWRDDFGKIRCLDESCEHVCSNNCPIYLNKCGKEKYNSYNHDEAIELLKRAVFLAPDYADAWCNLGYAYLTPQHIKESYEAFCEADKYSPNNQKIMKGEIIVLSKIGRHKEAQELLDKYNMLFSDKDSSNLATMISEDLSKKEEKPRITDEEYAKILIEKGFDAFWETLIEEKERSFASTSCEYKGKAYTNRCEHLKWALSLYIGGHEKGAEIIRLRKRLLQDNVKGAESMLLFDVIDEYEGKYRMITI